MTREEFNTKYDKYLERRTYTDKFAQPVEQKFGGLEFDIPEVTEFLDKIFTDFVKIPEFTYYQIKEKFGMTRFYSTLGSTLGFIIEQKIDSIIKNLEI